MTYDQILQFLQANHNGVLTTFRRSGAAQLSIVTCGPLQGGVAFTTTADRAKLVNLMRNPRCSILVSTADWRSYVVLEGEADIKYSDRTDPDELRLTLRDVYRTAAGREHPDWDEYDQAMVEQKRAAIIAKPDHIYGARV